MYMLFYMIHDCLYYCVVMQRGEMKSKDGFNAGFWVKESSGFECQNDY